MSTSKHAQIHTLHRYFIWANRMKHHCSEAIRAQGEPPSDGVELRMWFSAPFSYACYWFATLYVVVEGVQQLRLTTPTLTDLLKDDAKLQTLRRFRNGIYHYQTDYFDGRVKDFLTPPYLDWAIDLHRELSQFFIGWYESRGVVAEIVENIDERIRTALMDSNAGDVFMILRAADCDGRNEDEQCDAPKSPVVRERDA